MKESIIKSTMENLKRNGFNVKFFTNAEDAKTALLEEFTADESVGFGGSVTVDKLGIYEALKERGNPLSWHWRVSEGENRKDIYRRSANADIRYQRNHRRRKSDKY